MKYYKKTKADIMFEIIFIGLGGWSFGTLLGNIYIGSWFAMLSWFNMSGSALMLWYIHHIYYSKMDRLTKEKREYETLIHSPPPLPHKGW